MVSNKKYVRALEMWNKWENMATEITKQNRALVKEVEALIAECRTLRERLAVVTAERDHYLDLLPDVSEVEPATK